MSEAPRDETETGPAGPAIQPSKGTPSPRRPALVALVVVLALGAAASPWIVPRVRRALARRALASRGAPPLVTGRCSAGMAEIPAGAFQMGSTLGGTELLPHAVTMSAFCMDGSEVTVAAYSACVRKGSCTPASAEVGGPGTTPWDKQHGSQHCNADRGDRQSHPVNCVEWSQADAYCRAIGARLPTEEEWEYAARGTDGRPYPWGEVPPEALLLNACGTECVELWERNGKARGSMYDEDDGWEATAPVGAHPAGASPFGLVDLAGNVWEWTASSPTADDPKPPSGEEARILRGGSWSINNPTGVRASARGFHVITSRSNGVGFRCAKSLP
jgi:formylglycine-generating enzyme required for sulfatase activity